MSLRQFLALHVVIGFVLVPCSSFTVPSKLPRFVSPLHSSLQRVPAELEGVPIAFIDKENNSFIECYADAVADIEGVSYTIGVPCDMPVALCYLEEGTEELVSIDLDDELMDDVFSMAQTAIEDDFGEELVLARTPQSLTLVGELELDSEDDEARLNDEFEEDEGFERDEEDPDEEEVEVLLSFEHQGKEISLVRLLDPLLLVGKLSSEREDQRLLLTVTESEQVLPILEKAFLEFHDDPDSVLP